MWSSLIGIIEKRWHENRQPRKRLAKAVTALYGTMFSCHEAFIRYQDQPNEKNLEIWAYSIDALITTLGNLQVVLNIFHPDLFDFLKRCAMEEAFQTSLSCPDENYFTNLGLRSLARLIEEECNFNFLPNFKSANIKHIDTRDFHNAMNQLRSFIKKEFSMEEIFGAM